MDRQWKVRVIKSRRKTIALQIENSREVVVRAPLFLNDAQILAFLKEKSAWIERHMAMCREREETDAQQPAERLRAADIRALSQKALQYIPGRVAYFAQKMGLSYGNITIRNQRSRWGSCSAKGNLNFNCLLMLTTPEVIDYVVVHELCHLVEMNHSKRFWRLVEDELADYEVRRQWLKEHGHAIIRRMTG